MHRSTLHVSLSLLTLLALAALPLTASAGPTDAAPEAGAGSAKAEAERFLAVYNSIYQRLYTVDAEAAWASSTDVSEAHEAARTGADQVYAAFVGAPEVIRETRSLLARKDELEPVQVLQLQKILLAAGGNPGTIPDVVNARVAAESHQSAVLDGFVFCYTERTADGACPEPKTANDIVDALTTETDVRQRLMVWNASKEIGVPLKPGLVELQKLRNQVAREMGYSSYFGLMVADYGMTVPEMMTLLDGLTTDMAPLYTQLSTWANRQLAHRYGQKLPAGPMPAHWYPNRWAQEWGGLVEGADLDPYFKGKDPKWIVQTAEAFYVSMGFAPLPESFWQKSDLYPAPLGPDGQPTRLKNAHASAWHVDINDDVRSLMSVQADSEWFFTAHHELGHIYYYKSYTRPEVPPVLREGANRGFHEGIGELISLAAGQVPYLTQLGILPKGVKINPTQAMLVDALEKTVAFIPWSAGTMSHFEYELYEKDLPADQWQARWWAMAEQYQGVAVPDKARLTDPTLCDACTKTHINDDPAGYYDYAIATVIKYQLHEHIALKILKQDPHTCNYYGNKEVGAFLKSILEKGATEDWRKVLRDATGEDLSTRAMVAYFQPLQGWLEKENARAAGAEANGRK